MPPALAIASVATGRTRWRSVSPKPVRPMPPAGSHPSPTANTEAVVCCGIVPRAHRAYGSMNSAIATSATNIPRQITQGRHSWASKKTKID